MKSSQLEGGYITQPLATKSKDDRPNLVYPLIHNGVEIWPDKQWIWEKKRLYDAYQKGEIVINEKNGKYSVRFKQYLRDENSVMRKGKPLSLLISYDTIEGEYDSSIFTAEKATQSFDKAFLAKKAIQDYVFTDGSADKSIERKFAEDLDAAEEVCVYAKLPRTFQIPTPVGNYSPDWAIAFYEGTVKHIFFIAETKGTMESLELRPIEQAKISCAKKLFNEMSTSNVVYHDVDSYQSLLNIMNSL